MTIHNAGAKPSVAADEALDWVIRLTSGAATQADARAFEAWRAKCGSHAEAFRDAAAFRAEMRAMPLARQPASSSAPASAAAGANVVPFAAHRPNRTAVSRRGLFAGGGALAASAALAMFNPPFGLWLSLAELNAGERTGPGQRRTIRPRDGVTVELNARTAMNLADRADTAALVSGEAFVSVAAGARPVLLEVAGQNWTVHGAEVNVRTGENESCVTCLKGSVSLASGATMLVAGQQYVAADGQPGRVTPSGANRQGSWRQGILVFRNTPLAEAVEDINRYRDGKIILANAGVGRRTVSGLFHTDKIDNAVTQIQQLLNVEVTKMPGNIAVFS